MSDHYRNRGVTAASRVVNCERCGDTGWVSFVDDHTCDVHTPVPYTVSPYAALDAYNLEFTNRRVTISCAPCPCKLKADQLTRIQVATNNLLNDPDLAMYRGCTFESWDMLPERDRRGKEELRDCAAAWADNQPGIDGIVVSGPRGRGKTSLLTAALFVRAQNGTLCKWQNWTSLLRKIRGTYNGDSETSEDDILNELINVPCLLIDDFGPAIEGGKVTDYGRRIAWDLFAARYNAMRPTIITTNSPYRDLCEDFDPRLLERMTQVWRWIALGDDTTNMRVE